MTKSKAIVSLLVSLLISLLIQPTTATGSTNSATAYIDGPILKASGVTSALVHVRPHAELADGVAAARQAGLEIGTRYETIKVFVAYGRTDSFRTLARSPAIEALEANSRLRLFTDSSHEATRGEEVLNGAVTMPDGTVIDGAGIGVAVVDSGVEGTHPDLASRMGGNVKIVCTTPQPVATSLTGFTQCLGPKAAVPLADTDTPSGGGHGTHVAGTVAGTGEASGGLYHGAAPGATLYGVSVGTTLLVENGLDGLAWVLENHDQVTPAIRVVNNSWGSSPAEYDPDEDPFFPALWKLQEDLVAAGVTVVWAAGNSGGDGTDQQTGGECVNPTPGIICVANYDDNDDGRRNGGLDSSSSRGLASDPKTWPDISAPGTGITATCRLTLPVCNAHFGPVLDPPNLYATLSGTSMAAPHVAGIVAQLLQANPALEPAQIENILEDTAHKFSFGSPYGIHTDPFNPDDTSSFDKGHGLVDVMAALAVAMGGSPDPDPTPTPTPEPDPCTTTTAPADATTRYYFHSASGFGHADWASGASTFDTEPPGQTSDAYWFDVPIAGNGAPTAPWDPWWAGAVDGRIGEITLDFWVKAPQSEVVLAELTYNPSIWIGTTEYELPQIVQPQERAVTDAPVRVTATFTKLADGTALDLDPAGQEVAINIDGQFINGEHPGVIVYDSPEHPSGFSVGSGGSTCTSTTTEFTADSATSGQYSDEATVATRLVESGGAAIANAEVVFELSGAGTTKTWTATTDAGGIARKNVVLDAAPGSYTLTARYAGRRAVYSASEAATGFTIEADDSTTALEIASASSGRKLVATLQDADSGAGLAGQTITFFDDDVALGTAVTNADGVATFVLSRKHSRGYQEFDAVFGGDGFYAGSRDRAETE